MTRCRTIQVRQHRPGGVVVAVLHGDTATTVTALEALVRWGVTDFGWAVFEAAPQEFWFHGPRFNI